MEEDANDAKTTPNAEQLAPKKKKKKPDGGSGKQRKIRAVIKFGKGVQAETLESKFACIMPALNHHQK